MGIPGDKISLLAPGDTLEDLEQVPSTETEGAGVGPAVGGAVGAGVGAAVAVPLAMATVLLPGVGPVIGIGLGALALLGGVFGGMVGGAKIEEAVFDHGLPIDELHLYEDALRLGRSVVVVLTDDSRIAEVRAMLASSGAESIDAARERWWMGLRDAERELYEVPGREFERDEAVYRVGYESAIAPDVRALSFELAEPRLRERWPELLHEEPFRLGFESARGRGKATPTLAAAGASRRPGTLSSPSARVV